MTLPWQTIATESTSDGPLVLRRRGERDFLITIAGRVLMSSAAHRSEVELAMLACAGLRDRARARVLVSGLGMGYTLRAALDALGADASVCVAELNPVVVEWCKGPLGALTARAAEDPRVTLEVADVSHVIARVATDARERRFDAVVLDMYEGPHMRVRPNHPLYGEQALTRTHRSLCERGVFAIWCEAPSLGFEQALRSTGFRHEGVRAGRGARVHYVYVARKVRVL
jgi:spermidine synthase